MKKRLKQFLSILLVMAMGLTLFSTGITVFAEAVVDVPFNSLDQNGSAWNDGSGITGAGSVDGKEYLEGVGARTITVTKENGSIFLFANSPTGKDIDVTGATHLALDVYVSRDGALDNLSGDTRINIIPLSDGDNYDKSTGGAAGASKVREALKGLKQGWNHVVIPLSIPDTFGKAYKLRMFSTGTTLKIGDVIKFDDLRFINSAAMADGAPYTLRNKAKDIAIAIRTLPSTAQLTLEDAQQVEEIHKQYGALEETYQAMVVNKNDLLASVEKIETLRQQANAGKEEAAAMVEQKIEAIGEVTESNFVEKRQAIVLAEKAFNQFTSRFGEASSEIKNLSLLTSAREKYNSYAAEKKLVLVTDAPYGAKGDGVTNDRAAIQKAIDETSAKGGGIVVLPADQTFVTANLYIRSGVTLYFEQNARLKQTTDENAFVEAKPDGSYTPFPVTKGHEIHSEYAWDVGAFYNYPLIYGAEGTHDFKITGKGFIELSRGNDGSCQDTIHMFAILLFKNQNFEISDITIENYSSYAISENCCSDGLTRNVTIRNAADSATDGIGLSGGQNLRVTGCDITSGDDGLKISVVNGADPRQNGIKRADIMPAKNIEIDNNTVKVTWLATKAFCFLLWGTGYPDQREVECSDIYIHDNNFNTVGCWYGNWDMETHVFQDNGSASPLKNLRWENNTVGEYQGNWDVMPVSDFIGGKSMPFMRNTDFETTGDAYWLSRDGGNAGADDSTDVGQNGTFYGYIRDLDQADAALYQGIHITTGAPYIFAARVKSSGVPVRLFVRDQATDELIVSKEFTNTDWQTVTMEVEVPKTGNYRIGLERGNATNGFAYIDDCTFKLAHDTDAVLNNMDTTNNLALDGAIKNTASIDTSNYLEGKGAVSAKATANGDLFWYVYTADRKNISTLGATHLAMDIYCSRDTGISATGDCGINIERSDSTGSMWDANSAGKVSAGQLKATFKGLKKGWNHVVMKIDGVPVTGEANRIRIYLTGTDIAAGDILILDDIRFINDPETHEAYQSRTTAKDITLATRALPQLEQLDVDEYGEAVCDLYEQFTALDDAYQAMVLESEKLIAAYNKVSSALKVVELTVSSTDAAVSFNGKADSTLTVPQNQEFTLEITPTEGYRIDRILLGNTDITSQYKAGTLTLSGITDPTTLTVAAVKIGFTVRYGDVNGDQKIDAEDALAVLKHAVEKIELDNTQQMLADVSDDATIDAIDALYILKYAVQKINQFPVEIRHIKAAAAVDETIAAIGTVTKESKAAIEEARAAYEALTQEEKNLVYNLIDLEKAEEAWKSVKDEASVADLAVATYGRTYVDSNALFFNWTMSGFAFEVDGTDAYADFTINKTNNQNVYVNVYVDGAGEPYQTICLTESGRYLLAENLPEGTHTIKLLKRSAAELGTVGVSVLTTAGYFTRQTPKKADRTIEVLGDSITVGFGNLVTDGGSGTNTSYEEDGTKTYAAVAGSLLKADVTTICTSGLGFIYKGNGPDCVMSDLYPYVDGLNYNTTTEYDFSANPSDVVVISLGTNDAGWSSDTEYMAKASELLAMVREKNPDAVIIWCYGMMINHRSNLLKQVIQNAKAAGDDNVYYLALPACDPATQGTGVGNHPTLQSHAVAGEQLAQYIASITGWDIANEK